MKNESDLTRELIVDPLRAKHPDWVVIKHCDMFTKGVPDVSISNRLGKTLWVEVKRLRGSVQHLSDPSSWLDNLVQLDTTVRLGGYLTVIDASISTALVLPAQLIYPYRRSRAIPESLYWGWSSETRLVSIALEAAFFGLINRPTP